jgi:hypothetical protein
MSSSAQEAEAAAQAVRNRAAQRAAALAADFNELAALLGGSAPSAGATAVGKPRVMLFGDTKGAGATVPPAPESLGTPGILANLARYGIKERSYDVVKPVVAPNEIDEVGNSYDAGAIYDAWLLSPSCDCKIDFDKAPEQNTPYVSANSRMQFQVRKQKVYYLANTPGQTGTLSIWLLAYRDP